MLFSVINTSGMNHESHTAYDDSMIGTSGMDQERHPAHDSSAIGTSGMDQESHPAHDNSGWMGLGSYDASGMNYGHFGGYVDGLPSEAMTRLPSESIGRLPPLPTPIQPRPQQTPQLSASQQLGQQQQPQEPQQQHQPHHGVGTVLPMLTMPPTMASAHQWPSQYTNPGQMSQSSSYSAPPTLAPTLPMPGQAQAQRPKPAKLTTPGPRRTLTDEDRRRMCQYAHENPGVKQLEIGRLFGVERSTVSKVLRQREKFLSNEERSASPVKKQKERLPDIERALAIWAKKETRSGRDVTDTEIYDRARRFAHGVAGAEFPDQTLSASWLEKFKQRNGIGHGRLQRRASETNIPDSAKMIRGSPTLAPSQPSSAISPSSPAAGRSPLSGARSDDEAKDSVNDFYNFPSSSFKQAQNRSTTSLNSAFTDTGHSSFSGSAVSPTASLTFSPDSNVGGFLPPGPHLPGGEGSGFQRPRSQTFPTLDLEYMNQTGAAPAEPDTPKYTSTAPSSALESPDHDLNAPHFSLDSALASQRLRRPSSHANLVSASSSGSRSNSPTLEEARRGLDTALSYIQRSGSRYEENDLITVMRFFEKTGLRQYTQHIKTPSSSLPPLGGLSQIPESGEVEMTNAPPGPIKAGTMTA